MKNTVSCHIQVIFEHRESGPLGNIIYNFSLFKIVYAGFWLFVISIVEGSRSNVVRSESLDPPFKVFT